MKKTLTGKREVDLFNSPQGHVIICRTEKNESGKLILAEHAAIGYVCAAKRLGMKVSVHKIVCNEYQITIIKSIDRRKYKIYE
jgi:hypothetical protein